MKITHENLQIKNNKLNLFIFNSDTRIFGTFYLDFYFRNLSFLDKIDLMYCDISKKPSNIKLFNGFTFMFIDPEIYLSNFFNSTATKPVVSYYEAMFLRLKKVLLKKEITKKTFYLHNLEGFFEEVIGRIFSDTEFEFVFLNF